MNLNAVFASKVDFDYEVILLDNDSDDGTVEMVREEFLSRPEIAKKLTLIAEPVNHGFGIGNNIGIKHAKGEYILLLNSDAIVEPNVLQEMVDFMKSRPDVGMATCKLMKPNGDLDWACRRSEPDPWVAFFRLFGFQKLFPKSKMFTRYNLLNKSIDEETEIDCCVGAFMIISPQCLSVVKGFDEQFFMYGEDVDLCKRVRDAGFKVWYYPKVTTLHYKGQSTKKTPERMIRAFYDAMWQYYKKHYIQKYPAPFNWLVWIGTRLLLYKKLFVNYFKAEKVVSK